MPLEEKRQINIFIAIIVLLLITLLYQIYSKNKIEYKLNAIEIRTNSLINSLEMESEFEGNYIWDLLDISRNDIKSLLKKGKVESYSIVIWVDSITCFSCFNFHMENISELLDVSILISSPNNSEYVQTFLKNGIILEYGTGKLFTENIVVNFVSDSGRIIYSDIADKLNYDKSRRFYKKIKQYGSD